MKTRRKSWNNTWIIVVVSILVSITSCFDSNYDLNKISDEVELTPGIAIRLAHGTLTLDNILNEIDSGGFVRKYESDSLLYILYSKNLLSLKASEYINIPNQYFPQFPIDPKIPFDVILPGKGDTISSINIPFVGEFPLSFDQNVEFKFNNDQNFKSMDLHTFTIETKVESSFQHTGSMIIYSESILVSGTPFSDTIQIGDETGNFNMTFTKLLTNVKMVLEPNSTFLPLTINLKLINSGKAFRQGDKCDITMNFLDIKFASLFGYPGKIKLMEFNDTVDISIFNRRIFGGSISFANPQINLAVKNSFGVPIQVDLSNVESTSTSDPEPLIIHFNGNPFNFKFPDTAGKVAYDTIQINKGTSNIDEALNSSPNHLFFNAIATTNADPDFTCFVTDSSTIDLGVEVELPIEVNANGFELEDYMAFDFEKEFGSDLNMIKDFRLTFFVDNGFPMETKLQLYFYADSLKTLPALDSLFRNGPMFLSALDSSTTIISFDDLEKLNKAKFAFVNASVNTPAAGFSKFYSYNGIEFTLSAKADFIINSRDL